MSLNHPSLAHRALAAERDLLRVVADCGPLTGQYLAGQDARARAAAGPLPRGGGVAGATRPLSAACRSLGAALVTVGMRLQGPSQAADALAHPGGQSAAV